VGWWWFVLAQAMTVLVASSEALEIRGLEVSSVPGGGAVIVELSTSAPTMTSSVQDATGRFQRVYVDLPAGTTLAAGIPRRLSGHAPISAVRVGLTERGRVRLLVELSDAAEFVVRELDDGRRLLIAARADAAPANATPAQREETTPRRRAPPRHRRVRLQRPPRIVLDPGHGGDDPGALGYAVEKDVTLAIGHDLAALLRSGLGAEVTLTRSDDSTLPLAERTRIANVTRADLFVSIHANASPSGTARGIETYYLDNTNDQATLRLVAMENGGGREPPPEGRTDLRYILSSLLQGGKQDVSARLATVLQKNLISQMAARHDDIVDLGVKRGPFYVLVGAYMPCVLVETSFLDHEIEGHRLAGAPYRRQLAEGLYAGIREFLIATQRARTL
jgi:N-acetylmuramoyl-L-alanine amidase